MDKKKAGTSLPALPIEMITSDERQILMGRKEQGLNGYTVRTGRFACTVAVETRFRIRSWELGILDHRVFFHVLRFEIVIVAQYRIHRHSL